LPERLAAKCGFFAGYPITPASDYHGGAGKGAAQVGGTFLQAEDEMAALAAVLVPLSVAKRAMTATSGSGRFSLMTELIGLASMRSYRSNCRRTACRPSTGMPTKMEQSD